MIDLFDFSTFAVIPSALGPIQALMTVLPYLLAAFGTAIVGVFKPKTYRALLRYCWTHKGLTLVCLSPFALLYYRHSLFGAKVVNEKGGSAWVCFRGSPERTGAVPGAHGPFEGARIIWNELKSSAGQIQAIDSSPTVVGNRVYFGTSIQTPLKKSGSITCLDTDTGAVAWQFTGEGMDRPLQPVFSSPAIGGGSSNSAKAPFDEARYLVCGEGYHVEQDSRIICLDLACVRASGGKQPPEYKWSVQITNHVESSPCIFENHVYVGTGDDGWWCIDLESGKVKWRLEGNEYYVINAGPQADALAKLAGKTVAVDGSPKRYRPEAGKDFSIMFLDATGFKEVPPGTTMVPDPAQSSTGKEMRTVIGKVVVTDAINNPDQKGSRVKIEMEKVYPDAECDPVAVRIDGQPRLICGCGLDGQAVLCIDAENGKELWRTKTSDPVFCPPTYYNGQIFVGLSNGTFAGSAATPSGAVLALSAADGSELWKYKTADGVLGAVAIKDDKAYACSRDGSLYVFDIKNSREKEVKLIKKYDTGSTMVCSPAVTDQGVYMSNESGKLFCVRRDNLAFQWSLNLTPGQGILSSPCAAGNRLFIGSATRGIFCVDEEHTNAAVRKIVPPWSGPGGNAEYGNVADDRGPPSVNGNKSDRITEDGKITSTPTAGPVAACGSNLYFPARTNDNKSVLACVDTIKRNEIWQSEIKGTPRTIVANESQVFILADVNKDAELTALDAKTGKQAWSRPFVQLDQPYIGIAGNQIVVRESKTELLAFDINNPSKVWAAELGELVGAPALKHSLVFAAISAPKPQLICLDDSSGAKIWTADLPAKPLGGPSVSGDKVFITLAGKSASDAKIACRSLTDGRALWESDVEKAPVTPLAISGEHLAFTVEDGTVIVLETLKGEQSHTVLLGKGGQAPSIFQNILFLGAENRVGAYDLSSSSWIWAYRDQKTAGRVLTAPILANEAVWVSTEKQGLIAIGGNEKK